MESNSTLCLKASKLYEGGYSEKSWRIITGFSSMAKCGEWVCTHVQAAVGHQQVRGACGKEAGGD